MQGGVLPGQAGPGQERGAQERDESEYHGSHEISKCITEDGNFVRQGGYEVFAEYDTSAWWFGVLRAERRPSPGGDGSEREESRFRPPSGPGEKTERESQTVGRQVDVLH